jgi:peptide/nickel transport system permease protein
MSLESAEAEGTAPARSSSGVGYLWYQLRRSPLTMVGLGIIVVVLFIMVAAPWIAPYNPDKLDLLHRLAAPSLAHFFGTDEVGRDIFSRVLWGARTSVTVGLAIVAISMVFGTVIGAFSGLVGGRIDTLIMRFMDVVLSFPSFVMAMALAAALGPNLINAMLAIAVVRIPFYVRLARGQALSLRS